jgi:hypothetical protein
MVKVLMVKPIMSQDKADGYLGTLLGNKDYDMLINFDCDIFCEETGMLLVKFRKKQIDLDMIKNAYTSYSEAATVTGNRGLSAGLRDDGVSGYFKTKKDGTLSNYRVANNVNSGIIGFYDRTMRQPYCRTTSYTAGKFEKWKKCLPIVKLVSDKYRELVPDKWDIQKSYVDKTAKDFVVEGTVFTTITVNKNWQTACHTDKGDLEEGFGNLVVMRKGKYTGGYFVLVKWGIAIDLQNGDILFTDVHQTHGNTPIKKLTEGAERISLVMYYRSNMIVCGSAEEEIENTKNRKSLKGLNKRNDEDEL